jgi:hypothetical protein
LFLIFICLFVSCETKILTPVTPLDGEEIDRLRPHLEWEPVEGVNIYHIQIGTDSNFDSFFRETDLYNNFFDIDKDLKNNVTYYWRIKCYNDEENTYGEWSEPASFTIKLSVATPGLISPTGNKSVNSEYIDLSWENIQEAKEYEVQVDYYGNFKNDLLVNQKTYGPKYTITKYMHSGTYYWRVKAVDLNGISGAWSETGVFYYINPKESELMGDEEERKEMGSPNIKEGRYVLETFCEGWFVDIDVYINDILFLEIRDTTDMMGYIEDDCEWLYYGQPDRMFIEVEGIITTPDGDLSIHHTDDDIPFDNNFDFEINIDKNGNVSLIVPHACPWLYTWNSFEYAKEVEIIQNLCSESRESTQVAVIKDVYIEDNLVKLLIWEEKDEVSHIDEVVLIVNGITLYPLQDSENALTVSYIDNEYMIMEKGDTVELSYKIPFEPSDNIIWMVRSTGYYIPEQ